MRSDPPAAGPAAEDRVLALDTLYVNSMMTVLTLGIQLGSRILFRYRPADRAVWFRGLSRDGEVPAARRGDRAMTMAEIVPLWADLLASFAVGHWQSC